MVGAVFIVCMNQKLNMIQVQRIFEYTPYLVALAAVQHAGLEGLFRTLNPQTLFAVSLLLNSFLLPTNARAHLVGPKCFKDNGFMSYSDAKTRPKANPAFATCPCGHKLTAAAKIALPP